LTLTKSWWRERELVEVVGVLVVLLASQLHVPYERRTKVHVSAQSSSECSDRRDGKGELLILEPKT
jgi:hypothetical protein